MIPEYSNAALEAKDLFYNRRIVYVEGCQDVIFWSECFELLGISCIVEPVGGVKEIHKYIQKILNEDIDLLVALDRDYSNYTHDSYDDKRILITPCHSIENLIFCFPMANKIIKRYTSQNKNFLDRIKKEAKKFEELFFDFLVYDILNIIHKRGIDVLDKSFMSYIDKNGLLDQERYNNKLKKIKEELHETELFEKIKIQIGDNIKKYADIF